MTGDRLWTPGQRSIAVDFLGRRAVLPEAPHRMALISGAPIFIFFAIRTGDRRYHFSITGPCEVAAASRAGRVSAVRESAQRYADILAGMARRHPRQWYHFERFLTD